MNKEQLNLLNPPAEMAGQLTTAEDIKNYILAGNATFTLRSKSTGVRFTYKVRKSKPEAGKEPVYFVSLMNGPDNEGDFCYMGIINPSGEFKFTAKSTVRPTAPSAKAFVWFHSLVVVQGRMSEMLECWHEGSCGRCGRKLTVPESVARGIGPECASKMGGE